MPLAPRLSRLTVIGALCLLASPGLDASVHAARSPIVVTGETPVTSLDYHTVWARRPTEERVTNSGQIKRVTKPLALAEFSLTASEGDHHIQRLGVVTNAGIHPTVSTEDNIFLWFDHQHRLCSYTGDLSDIGCQHRFSFEYKYRVGMHEPQLSFVGGEYTTASAHVDRCKGACTISLGERPAGHRFVLSGFHFRRLHDHALVRRVSVMLVGANEITVRFQDEGDPEFEAWVHGLWLPERAFAGGTANVELRYQPGKPAPDYEIGFSPFALVGFDFEFENGAHAMRQIGIRYAPPNLAPRFYDQNTDDPWHVKFKYARLK